MSNYGGYDSGAEDAGLSAEEMTSETAGGDTAQDESVSDQYSSFESGFNAAAALNNTVAAGNKTASTMGGKSALDPSYQSDFASGRGPMVGPIRSHGKDGWGWRSLTHDGEKSMNYQQQLSNVAGQSVKDMTTYGEDRDKEGKLSPLGSYDPTKIKTGTGLEERTKTVPGKKEYDTLNPNYKSGLDRFLDFTDYKQAGKDRDEHGEFYQAGFQANIPTHSGGLTVGSYAPKTRDPKDPDGLVQGQQYPSSIPNPGASRTGLPFDMAYSVANHPLGRWSSGPEKAAALAQQFMPMGIGTVVGGLRTLGYMGTGEGPPAQPTEDIDYPQKRLIPKVTARKTAFADGSGSGSGGPTRSQMRSWRGQGRTGGGY